MPPTAVNTGKVAGCAVVGWSGNFRVCCCASSGAGRGSHCGAAVAAACARATQLQSGLADGTEADGRRLPGSEDATPADVALPTIAALPRLTNPHVSAAATATAYRGCQRAYGGSDGLTKGWRTAGFDAAPVPPLATAALPLWLRYHPCICATGAAAVADAQAA